MFALFLIVEYSAPARAGTSLTSGMRKDYFCFIMTPNRDAQTVLGSPRWDILSTVMRASLRLTVADGEVYIEPWNSAARSPLTDTSVRPACTRMHHIRPLMDGRTNKHALN